MMNNYWRARFCGPLAPYSDGLRAELAALAYAPSTVTSHLGLWAQLDRWLVERGLNTSELTAVKIEEFLVERGQAHRYLYSIRALAPGLEFLRRVGAVPEVGAGAEESAVEVIERQFRKYLLVAGGLGPGCPQTRVFRVWAFLGFRVQRGRQDLVLLG